MLGREPQRRLRRVVVPRQVSAPLGEDEGAPSSGGREGDGKETRPGDKEAGWVSDSLSHLSGCRGQGEGPGDASGAAAAVAPFQRPAETDATVGCVLRAAASHRPVFSLCADTTFSLSN